MNNGPTTLNDIANLIYQTRGDIQILINQQKASNYLALATNPNVPEGMRQDCLNRAMNLMSVDRERDSANDLGIVFK